MKHLKLMSQDFLLRAVKLAISDSNLDDHLLELDVSEDSVKEFVMDWVRGSNMPKETQIARAKKTVEVR